MSQELKALVAEIESAAGCSHPIRLVGESVNLATGEVVETQFKVACKDRRRVVCPACSHLYQSDAWILVSSGLIGGKGVPDDVAGHAKIFVTLTAPSFGSVHSVNVKGQCTPTAGNVPVAWCEHGQRMWCRTRHVEHAREVGRPLCRGCFDYAGAVIWNATASRLWSDTMTRTRRNLAATGGVPQARMGASFHLSYVKVAEYQRRGLIHFHSVLRVDGSEGAESDAPGWLTSDVLALSTRRAVRDSQVWAADGRPVGWGQMLDVQVVAGGDGVDERVASYLAKYVVKSAFEAAGHGPFRSRRHIAALLRDEHERDLALAAWDLASAPALVGLRLRENAHAFGYAGHLITKSRGFSTTFGELRRVRAQFRASQSELDPVEGTFRYDGRGYDDPRGSEAAEVFFAMRRDLEIKAASVRNEDRIEGAPRRRGGAWTSRDVGVAGGKDREFKGPDVT